MKTIRILGRMCLVAFLLLVSATSLLPAVARAQWATAGGASVADVLAALVGQDVASARYVATATTGSGYTCNAALAACLDMPGANAQIGTNAGGDLLLGPENGAGTNVKIGPSIVFNGATGALVNTALDLYNGGYLTNSVGGPVLVDDVYGLRIAPKALGDLPTCGETAGPGTVIPGTLIVITATAVVGSNRVCFCESDGAASPTYAWRNLIKDQAAALGNSTTCPAT